MAYGGFSALCLLHIGGITESNFFDGEGTIPWFVICTLIFSLSYQFKTKTRVHHELKTFLGNSYLG